MTPKEQYIHRELEKLDAALGMSLSKGWRQTIKEAINDPNHWGKYDSTIEILVAQYNQRLKSTGMPHLDWHLIKAMIWVETGAERSEWRTRPMQMGNTGDAGMGVVLRGEERIDLILPPQERKDITEKQIKNQGDTNIKVGIAYLLNRLCRAEAYEEVDSSNPSPQQYTVKPGDSFEKIAQATGSSINNLRHLNSIEPNKLQPGQTIQYQKIKKGMRITHWEQFTYDNLALYNGRGDIAYARKLWYVLDVFRIIQNAPI
jgi:hypothetical protein